MPAAVVLALYWFTTLVALGLFFPLFSLYLSENLGLSGAQVGIVTAVLPLTGMAAQPLWGALADRSGSRVRLLALVTAATSAGYLLLAQQRTFGSVLAATVLLATCSTSVMPMSVAVSLALLRKRGRHAFGIVRSAGTFGYLVAIAGFPLVLSWFGHLAPSVEPAGRTASEPRLGLMLLVASAAMLAGSAIATALPRMGEVATKAQGGDWRVLFSTRSFRALLAVAFLDYLFLQGPLVMFPMYVRSLGGDLEVVSRLWVWMLAFEIPLLAGVAALPSRFGPRELVGLGIAADTTRWLVCGLSGSLEVVTVVQVLHGLAVAGFVVGNALYVEAVVPGRLRSSAQALLYTVGAGFGAMVSSAASGALVDAVGPRAPALIGGLGGLVLVLSLPRLLPAVARHAHDEVAAMQAADERPSA